MATSVLDPDDVLSPEPAALTGALIGYARVSTRGQNLDRQLRALNDAGCLRVFADKKTGKTADRPDLTACLDYLRPGDTLVVPSLDRLARSLQDLITIVGDLRRRQVGFRSLHEALDTTTPGGRLVFHVFGALAEFIRELIIEGTHEGLAAARARGARLGRPPALNAEQVRQARALLTQPGNSVASIARLLGVSRSTLYKHVPELAGKQHQALPADPAPAAVPAVQAPESVLARIATPVARTPRAVGAAVCPTCGDRPVNIEDRRQLAADLTWPWLYPDPDHPGGVVDRQHCRKCQPTGPLAFASIVCPDCGGGPFVAGEFGLQMAQGHGTPEPIDHWLAQNGWHHRDGLLVCGNHAEAASL